MESNVANEKESLLLRVERQIFTNQEQFDDNFQKNELPVEKNGMYCLITDLLHFLIFYLLIVDTGMFSQLKASCSSQCSAMSSRKFWCGLFPIIGWLSKYSLKDQLMGDVMSGCTVAIMHIPQG